MVNTSTLKEGADEDDDDMALFPNALYFCDFFLITLYLYYLFLLLYSYFLLLLFD